MTSNIIKEMRNCTFLSVIWSLLCLVGCSSSECSYQCKITEQQCRVCFESCNQTDSKSYIFYNCSQQEQKNAGPYKTTDYNLNQCAQHCCSQSLSSFQIYNLFKCQDSQQQQSQKIATIIIASLVGLLLLIICIICGHPTLRQKVTKCLCDGLIKSLNEESQSIIIKDKSIKVQNEEIECNKLEEQILKQLFDTVCSICLQKRCDVRSNCGHSYHIKCFWKWYNLKKACSVCQLQDITILRYYCSFCQRKIIHRPIIPSKSPNSSIKILMEIQCQHCKDK